MQTQQVLIEYEISTDVRRLDVGVIHGFLASSYGSPGIPRAIVERAVQNSLCFGVCHHAAPTTVSGHVLTSAQMDAHNTFESPHALEPATFSGASLGGAFGGDVAGDVSGGADGALSRRNALGGDARDQDCYGLEAGGLRPTVRRGSGKRKVLRRR